MKRTSKRPTRSAVKFTPAGWPERLARQVALVACPPVLRGERRHPEPVREFESEIHKFLSLNNLRVLSLIKVDSLLARTYVGERRILGQAPRNVWKTRQAGHPLSGNKPASPALQCRGLDDPKLGLFCIKKPESIRH